MPLVSVGQSISGSISVVQGQQATYSLNGSGCNSGNYDDVSWSTSATLLECVSYATTACMEINVRFDTPGSHTIVVSYSCNEGGSGWASLTVNVAPPPTCPPALPASDWGNYYDPFLSPPNATAFNLSPCETYTLVIYFSDGTRINISLPLGTTYYRYMHPVANGILITYACVTNGTMC